MIDLQKLERILPKVEKPARYIGEEMNRAKSKADVPVRFLFAFPDVYEVGMSHLGTTILYNQANERQDVAAERTFAPFGDMQAAMKEAGIPLYSLESYTPAKEFDIIGFNLSYEMCYTTVLAMLDLAQIPIHSRERDESWPLVIAGGACTYNPEPLWEFIDLFIIGEGEEVNQELIDLYIRKKQNFKKEEFLREAAKIEGIYVPELYRVSYHGDGKIERIEGKTVRKRFIRDMDKAYYFTKPIVPFVNTVHDRATLEVFRGCTRGCRFCQAGMIYRPVREKSVEVLKKQAEEIIKNTGYEEISLSSLSTGDYSKIEELSVGLVNQFRDRHVSVSLPSLRVDSFDKEYAKVLQTAKKSSFTFAPEVGTQRLRDVINKNVTEEEILRGVRYAFESGCTSIKLYFMIGLPTETYEDLDGIVDLAMKVWHTFKDVPKELRRGSLRLHISTSSFVPKPFTPFEWEAQDTMEELTAKQAYLKEKLNMRVVKYNWHNTELSFLEAVFARGDRRLSKVLESAFRQGAMFDSWADYFDFSRYQRAFEEAGIDPTFYANREREEDEIFPYEHIDCLVSKRYLLKERHAAYQAALTPDCRQGCTGCGLMKDCAQAQKGKRL